MQHLDEGTIHAWLDGALSSDEAATVERHTQECAECAALVADARGLIAGAARIVSALDDVPAGVIPARPAASPSSLWRTLRLTPFRAALAASLMVAAASLAVVRYAPRGEPKADTTVMRVTINPLQSPAAPAASPAAATPAPRSADQPRRAAVANAAREADTVKRLAQSKVETAPAAEARKAVNALMDSVAARATGGVVSAAPATQAEPSRAGAAGATADAMRREAPMRPAASAFAGNQLTLVAMSADERPLELPGCYRLQRDSTNETFELPERLSLEGSAQVTARPNIVRAVTPDGRRDSLITGITWRAQPGATRIVFTTYEPSVQSFRQRTTNAGGRQLAAAAMNPARLTHIDCR